MRVARSIFLPALLLLVSHARSQDPVADTLLPKAIAFLEHTLNDLRHVQEQARSFTMAFTDETARVPCDICPDREQLMDPHKYAFQVEGHYPSGFPFTYSLERDAISSRKLDRSEYEWRVPLTKNIPASSEPSAPHLSKPFTVHQVAVVKYLDGSFSLRTVEAITPPAPHLMLELLAMKGLGTPAFEAQPDFTPEVSSTLIGVGASWYFAPFSTGKPGNPWLKAGLRLMQRTDELTADEVGYERTNVEHTQVEGADGALTLTRSIDVTLKAHDIQETVRSTMIGVPLGVAQRMALSDGLDLSLEIEASYNFVISQAISGSYELDQIGGHHRINGELMEASGGGDLIYSAPDAAVVVQGTGERIDFFSGRTSALDDLDAGPKGVLGFAFLPSLFIKKNDRVKYMIGLRLQWMEDPRASDATLDPAWFLDDEDTSRPTLGSLTSDGFRLFAGLTFSTTL